MTNPDVRKMNAFAHVIEPDGYAGIQQTIALDIVDHDNGPVLGLGYTDVLKSRTIDPVTFDIAVVGSLKKYMGSGKLPRPHYQYSFEVDGQGPFEPKNPYEADLMVGEKFAVGSAALVAVLESQGIVWLGQGSNTPDTPLKMDEKDLTFHGSTIGKAFLLLLQEGQIIRIASDSKPGSEVYDVAYKGKHQILEITDSEGNIIEEDDGLGSSGGSEGSGPNNPKDGGSDRNPSRPIKPSGSAGAAVAIPRSRGELPPLRGRSIKL